MKGSISGLWLLAGLISLSLIAAVQSGDYRLSTEVLPSHYKLTLNIPGDATSLGTTFDGEVDITLRAIDQHVLQITLHMDSLNITSCALYNKAGLLQENFDTAALHYEDRTQQLTLPLAQTLVANDDYVLKFKFTGKVRTDMAGLFSASYLDQTNKSKTILLTQLQRLNARLVFPCFDEPAFKAKFELQISRPIGYNAISNTKLIKTTDAANNRQVDHFEVTPVMSTYLLAFIISDYRARGDVNNFAVLSRPEFYDKTAFSFTAGERALVAYNDLFQQTYKQLGNEILLFASSPRFPYNGMENWGLVIYSDSVLVQDPGYTDGWKNKEFTLRIVAHETSHMWFGNSVTFSWWSYFWLNEAFARYYEYFMAHQLNPEYRLDQQFIVRQTQMILQTDGTSNTQPLTSLEANVETPAQIGNKFSSIAYAKGASIVRMWRNIMGGENFDKSIRSYLKEHHLGNTEPSDLFNHLKQNWPASPEVALDDFFEDFTEQPGYPMITVSLNVENNRFELKQKRFVYSRSGVDASLRYTIPITFATNVKPNFYNMTPGIYFRKINTQVNLNSKDPVDWIILNLQQSNYYRVLYDNLIQANLKKALEKDNHTSIPAESRSQIVDDLFNFAHADIVDYREVFEFVEYMSKEVDYIPWYSAYQGFQHVAKRLTPQQQINFEKYLGDITVGVYSKLGVKWQSNDTILDVYNRNMQISWLCKYRNVRCNNQLKESFENNTEKPSPDYRETYYCGAARTTGYARVLELFYKETNENERNLLWRAASCTRDYRPHYEKEILGSAATSAAQKAVSIAQMYQQNPDMVTPIFHILIEDINKLKEALGTWARTAEVLTELADYFTNRDQERQFNEFIDKNANLFGTSASDLRAARSTVSKNLDWAETRLDKVVDFLASRNGAAGLTVVTTLIVMMSSLLSLFFK